MVRRFWHTFWTLWKVYPWTEGAQWTHAHAEALRAFSEGTIGKELASHLRNVSLQINARAVQSGDQHECGKAAGFLLALAYIDSLSVPGGEPQSPTQDEDSVEGVEEFLERMAP